MLTIFGERDGKQMERLLEKLPLARKNQAQWAIAVQWGRRHEFGQANNLSSVFLNEVIRARLPAKNARERPVRLQVRSLRGGWLGDPSTWSKEGRQPVIALWADFTGDRDRVCWLPSQRVAAVWQAFVSASKEVKITPPGLGDGQPFLVHPARKPVQVEVALSRSRKPTRVEL